MKSNAPEVVMPVLVLQDADGDIDDGKLARSGRVVMWIVLLLTIALVGAWFGMLDEVSTGTGKVIPSSREQVLQSLDGGVLVALGVKEGQKVEAGQIVARLDPTRSESNVGESEARYRAALAASARLFAEVNDEPLKFPHELDNSPDLVAAETRLYQARRTQYNDSAAQIKASLSSVISELGITQRLVTSGAASNVDVLRLKRQKADLELKLLD